MMTRFFGFCSVLLLATLLSCKEDDNGMVQNNQLVGKWKLTEALYDPGDGSGTYRKVEEHASSVLEFRADGSFKETKGPIYSSINPFTRYKILDSSRVQLEEPHYGKDSLIWYISELTPTSVTIGFGCDERCEGKFVSIK